jgi:glucose-6-phosphate 1-dehydrogenase
LWERLNLETMHRLISGLRYISSDFESAPGWQKLHSVFDEIDRTENVGGNYFFYLATAPEVFLPLVMHLAAEGLLDESGPGTGAASSSKSRSAMTCTRRAP